MIKLKDLLVEAQTFNFNKSKVKYEICEESSFGELAPAYKIIDVRDKLNK